ncbi:AroM family protein [Oscillospiraceae bacterium NSJ-54]|uniref:AroM family protein n=1 Tax=Zongyangia hominis TaxID=2763677 RepID=A0A926EFX5_9FIRM|nr:AroM family protein [Zongyangia hominis]
MKVGAITVGQAPRVDVTKDILPILGENIELIQAGALDGMSKEELKGIEPQEGDYVLVSRLRDGSSVRFAERHILPRLQAAIDKLTAEGAELILMLCTGEFPPELRAEVPLLYPCRLLDGIVPAVAPRGRIGVVVPDISQKEQNIRRWDGIVSEVTVAAASPYADMAGIKAVAGELRALDVDVLILDCIGYTQEMKELLRKETGKKILLPRTVLARVVRELVD